MFRNEFGRFSSRAGKGSVGRRFITAHLSDYAFAPGPRKRNGLFIAPGSRKSTECAQRTIEIALAQRSAKPMLGYVFGVARIFSEDGLYCGEQRARVGMPIKLDFRTRSSQRYLFWSNGNCAL